MKTSIYWIMFLYPICSDFCPFPFGFCFFPQVKKKHHSPNEISILYITQTMEWIFYIVKGDFSLHKLFFLHFLESILELFVLGKSEILCFCIKRNVYSISYMKTFLVFNKHMILKLPAFFLLLLYSFIN